MLMLSEMNFILASSEKLLPLQIFWKYNCFNKLLNKNEKWNESNIKSTNIDLGKTKNTFEINQSHSLKYTKKKITIQS